MNCTATKVDYLIVGQGLAGSLLAWRLIEAGRRAVVVSDPCSTSASRVAAGLFNPVTGRRLTLAADTEQAIETATTLYRDLEKRFQTPLFHTIGMLRVIEDERLLKRYWQRLNEPCYSNYLGAISREADTLNAPLGYFTQSQTGYLDTNRLLDCIRSRLINLGALCESKFEPASIRIKANGCSWQDFRADRIIFCEGAAMRSNPWFSWLPLQPSKGEIVHFESSTPLGNKIINRGNWLLPFHDGSYKTGATYSHNIEEPNPDAGAKPRLLERMQSLFSTHVTVKSPSVFAGIRPNTLDKQPLIGIHPDQPRLAIFNGFGSRGSMLIPYYSEMFANHLEQSAPIEAAVDIRRYSA